MEQRPICGRSSAFPRILGAAIATLAVAWSSSIAMAQPLARDGDPDVVRFDGQKVIRATVRDSRDLILLGQVAPDCWSHSAGSGPPGTLGTLDYRVTASALEAVKAAGIPYEVLIEDLQAVIDEENARLRDAGHNARGWFDDYKNPDEVSQYIDGLVAAYPGLASREQIGASIEGRPIYALRMKGGEDPPAGNRPIILLNSVQHAREWISVMTTVYISDQLLSGYGVDPRATAMLNRYEIVIVPIVNADGFQYTWTTNRLWRKNRRNNGDGTFGVDTNRNWSFAWGSNNGSSGIGSSDTYRGKSPFSEPETAAMRGFTLANPGIVMHLDVHSYGPLLLYPWGYSSAAAPAVGALQRLAFGMRQAILDSGGIAYTAGQCYQTLYPVSGGSIDWYYGDRGIYSWTPELRGPNFSPPPSTILPCAREIYAAVLWLGENYCEADADATGFLDTEDYDAFVHAFEAGSSAADFDHSGFVDTDDFDGFVHAFTAGCP